MAIQDRLLSLASKVLQVISLKNVAIWAFTGLIIVIGYTVFEQRTAIVNYLFNSEADVPTTASAFKVSEASAAKIKTLVDSSDLINAVTVLNADIRNNRRVPLHWYSDEPSIMSTLDAQFSGRHGGIPLFTSDEKNNESVVGVINGEFACSSFDDGGNSSLFQGLNSRFPYVCRTSLPPYYGQFSGYITLSLNRVPTQVELDALKSETLNLSTEIYFRDVLPQSRHLSST